MQEEIIVLINKDGEVQTEVKGVKGKRCVELTEFISVLGESTKTLKTDYYLNDKKKISLSIAVDRVKSSIKNPA